MYFFDVGGFQLYGGREHFLACRSTYLTHSFFLPFYNSAVELGVSFLVDSYLPTDGFISGKIIDLSFMWLSLQRLRFLFFTVILALGNVLTLR